MRTLAQWLGQYSESHRNPRNKQIHWVCVPLIVWSVCALLWVVPMGWAGLPPGCLAVAAGIMAVGFYLVLSHRLAALMAIYFAVCLGLCWAIAMIGSTVLLWTGVSVFVLAWIGQFVGHEIEGKKPSFLIDLAFLLIGPAWIAHALVRRLGGRL
jgi:uncharacterized membrane protein YGL010W